VPRFALIFVDPSLWSEPMIRVMGSTMSKWHEQREGDDPFVQRTGSPDDGVMAQGTSERADIARRVSAFRDRQRLIRQQREDYCNAVQAQTRAALREDGRIPRN
jgi:hypothetical protein